MAEPATHVEAPAFAARARAQRLIGSAPPMRALREGIALYGPSDATVLVTGETGTGKELVAHALHAASDRARNPFVAVNCAALSPSLFESELFGSARGAFTGADRNREGLVGAARGGTLFLDEVGELAIELQPKLLRLLETGSYRQVGGEQERHAELRFVAATNRDLKRDVRARRFRSDLFYRLAVLRLHAPALRAHPEDIAALVGHFVVTSPHAHAPAPPRITEGALDALRAWSWPGNVRELRHVVERTLIRTRCSGLPIGAFELDPLDTLDERHEWAADDAIPNGPWTAAGSTPPGSRDAWIRKDRAELLALLERERWNVAAAARALGVSRGALRSRMRRLELGR